MDDRRRRVSCSLSSTIACPRVQDPDLASDARPLTISHPLPIVRLQLAGPVLDVRVSPCASSLSTRDLTRVISVTSARLACTKVHSLVVRRLQCTECVDGRLLCGALPPRANKLEYQVRSPP